MNTALIGKFEKRIKFDEKKFALLSGATDENYQTQNEGDLLANILTGRN